MTTRANQLANASASQSNPVGRPPNALGPVTVKLSPADVTRLNEIATNLSLEREHVGRVLIHLAMKDGVSVVSAAIREALAAAAAKGAVDELPESDP
jgi:predicted transcriptional regulator